MRREVEDAPRVVDEEESKKNLNLKIQSVI